MLSRKAVIGWLKTTPGIVSLASVLCIVLNALVFSPAVAEKERAVSVIRSRMHASRSSVADPAIMYARAVKDIEAFKGMLPDEQAVNGVFASLYEDGKKGGLKMLTGRYSPENVKKAGISRYTVVLPVEGSYAEVKRFVGKVEVMKELIVIEDISFKKGSPAASSVTAELRLSAYYK